MPSSAVKRKLRSANNAWKGLTTLLRSKLFLLKRSKAFKRTATGLNTAIATVLGRRRRRRRRRFRVKNLPLPRLPSDPAAGCNRTKIQRQRRRAVYVDDLFARFATPVGIMVGVQPAAFVGKVPADEAAAPPEAAAGGPVEADASHIGSSPTVVKAGTVDLCKTAPGDLIGGREGRGEGSSSSSGIHQLEGVDLKAELFIAKFREEMRRQK